MKRQISEIEREIIERTNRASKCDSIDVNTSEVVHSNSQETGIQLLDSLGLFIYKICTRILIVVWLYLIFMLLKNCSWLYKNHIKLNFSFS